MQKLWLISFFPIRLYWDKNNSFSIAKILATKHALPPGDAFFRLKTFVLLYSVLCLFNFCVGIQFIQFDHKGSESLQCNGISLYRLCLASFCYISERIPIFWCRLTLVSGVQQLGVSVLVSKVKLHSTPQTHFYKFFCKFPVYIDLPYALIWFLCSLFQSLL